MRLLSNPSYIFLFYLTIVDGEIPQLCNSDWTPKIQAQRIDARWIDWK